MYEKSAPGVNGNEGLQGSSDLLASLSEQTENLNNVPF
jgi:hypothetical protein